MKKRIKSWENIGLTELEKVAKEIVLFLQPNDILCFNSSMGSGKTTIIQEIVRSFGIKELQGSPTFSLVNHYETDSQITVYHMDLYRIESNLEAINAGIDELLYNKGICLIEWALNIKDLLPLDCLELEIEVLSFEKRNFYLCHSLVER
jgi:tRNA threonylcarbamoyladenosine biosynthesis protein TsaE